MTVNQQILTYLTQQRESSNRKKEALKTANLGLPPLQQMTKRGFDDTGKKSSKRASRDSRQIEKDKARNYQDIQKNLEFDPAGSGARSLTPTKVVSVHPNSRQAGYNSRRPSRESQKQRALLGIRELSTVYT